MSDPVILPQLPGDIGPNGRNVKEPTRPDLQGRIQILIDDPPADKAALTERVQEIVSEIAVHPTLSATKKLNMLRMIAIKFEDADIDDPALCNQIASLATSLAFSLGKDAIDLLIESVVAGTGPLSVLKKTVIAHVMENLDPTGISDKLGGKRERALSHDETVKLNSSLRTGIYNHGSYLDDLKITMKQGEVRRRSSTIERSVDPDTGEKISTLKKISLISVMITETADDPTMFKYVAGESPLPKLFVGLFLSEQLDSGHFYDTVERFRRSQNAGEFLKNMVSFFDNPTNTPKLTKRQREKAQQVIKGRMLRTPGVVATTVIVAQQSAQPTESTPDAAPTSPSIETAGVSDIAESVLGSIIYISMGRMLAKIGKKGIKIIEKRKAIKGLKIDLAKLKDLVEQMKAIKGDDAKLNFLGSFLQTGSNNPLIALFAIQVLAQTTAQLTNQDSNWAPTIDLRDTVMKVFSQRTVLAELEHELATSNSGVSVNDVKVAAKFENEVARQQSKTADQVQLKGDLDQGTELLTRDQFEKKVARFDSDAKIRSDGSVYIPKKAIPRVSRDTRALMLYTRARLEDVAKQLEKDGAPKTERDSIKNAIKRLGKMIEDQSALIKRKDPTGSGLRRPLKAFSVKFGTPPPPITPRDRMRLMNIFLSGFPNDIKDAKGPLSPDAMVLKLKNAIPNPTALYVFLSHVREVYDTLTTEQQHRLDVDIKILDKMIDSVVRKPKKTVDNAHFALSQDARFAPGNIDIAGMRAGGLIIAARINQTNIQAFADDYRSGTTRFKKAVRRIKGITKVEVVQKRATETMATRKKLLAAGHPPQQVDRWMRMGENQLTYDDARKMFPKGPDGAAEMKKFLEDVRVMARNNDPQGHHQSYAEWLAKLAEELSNAKDLTLPKGAANLAGGEKLGRILSGLDIEGLLVSRDLPKELAFFTETQFDHAQSIGNIRREFDGFLDRVANDTKQDNKAVRGLARKIQNNPRLVSVLVATAAATITVATLGTAGVGLGVGAMAAVLVAQGFSAAAATTVAAGLSTMVAAVITQGVGHGLEMEVTRLDQKITDLKRKDVQVLFQKAKDMFPDGMNLLSETPTSRRRSTRSSAA